jgi:hypothetical protein
MTKWTSDSYSATHTENGIELRLTVERGRLSLNANAWYWKVHDEEGHAVASGSREGTDNYNGLGPAKSACTRAAKAYCKGTRQ